MGSDEPLVPELGQRSSRSYASTVEHRMARLMRTNRRLLREIRKRKRAHATLRARQQHLDRLAELQDYERRTISCEIHDGLAQDLAGALMYLGSLRSVIDRDPDEAWKMFDRGFELLRQGHAECRRLIGGLHCATLDDCGPAAAIEELIVRQQTDAGPAIEFDNGLGTQRLPPLLETTIFRVVQEGLSNACRHSGSNRVRVELIRAAEDRVQLTIEDWGAGFDAHHIRKGAFGLKGIKQRVRLLQGRLKIESRPGHGTRIVVQLPIAKDVGEERR